MQIREFTGTDFDAVARLLGSARHAHHGSHAHWMGADELCAGLAQADKGFVAIDDGAVRGVVLVRSPRDEDHNDMLRMHWLQQRTRIAAMAQALGIDARADVQAGEGDGLTDADSIVLLAGDSEVYPALMSEANSWLG